MNDQPGPDASDSNKRQPEAAAQDSHRNKHKTGSSSGERKPPTGFAPNDFSDGRPPGDWRTRYTEPAAQAQIKYELKYVGCFLVGAAILLCAIFLMRMWYPSETLTPLWRAAVAWLGGVLGGAVFSAKWLYHSVAKWTWNEDRRLWRYLTPLISGALAFAMIMLLSSGVIRLFDPLVLRSLKAIVGVGFLVGYFSDMAVAKLTEIANTLFGSVRHSMTTAPGAHLHHDHLLHPPGDQGDTQGNEK